MKGRKCFGVLLALFTIFGVWLGVCSEDTNATTAQATEATVDFWSSSSSSGQVQATVDLPWSASIGGSASNRQQFYLNNISMIYPISAPSGTSNVYGRLTMRFTPNFTSDEDAYFCDYRLSSITSSVNASPASCTAIIIYYYGDGTSYQSSVPLYFNYTLPSGSLVAYVDYNQPLPNSGLSQVGLYIAKSGNNDVYSITNGYSLVLTTLVSDGSYYTNGSATDLSPIINQNNTIINQNNETNQYLSDQAQKDQQDRDDLEDASDDASSGANSAQSQAQTAGTTLLKAFSDFVGAITNASASDCIIDADMGNLDLGEIDLCQLSLPQPFQILASLTVIGFCVPLSIATAKKLIALIRSFQ